MERNRDEEKNKKFTSTIKNKMFKGYQKVRNKIHTNLEIYDSIQKFSYDNENNNPYNFNFEKYFSNSKEKTKKDKLKNSFNSIDHIDIQHLSKTKKDDYNNILNKLFFTTSNIIKNQKYIKNKKQNINFNNYNIKDAVNDINEKNEILNKLFPDINEINKYSNLPFFSLVKVKSPYKMKLNSNNKKEINKKFPQEEFLYKISHYHNDDEKINYNFIKNKGIKKGRTTKYFHGVNKFCINNKISETNFYKEDDINNKKLKLKLDISNLTKGGEGVPQISTKEKHIKILQNNLKNIKLIPNKLINDLEDGVFKFIDEEFDKKNNESSNNNNDNNNNEEVKIDLPNEPNKNNNSNNSNIINLNTQFQMKNTNNKYFQTEIGYQQFSKNKSYYNNSSNFNSSGFKKPQQYPINFYSTQQLKIKEHFDKTYKNTFDERNKKLKGNNSERNTKKKLSDEILNNVNELHKKKIINNRQAYKKESKIRDIIIGNKLKCEFNSKDIKRILNGLKPWADIKLEQDINFNNDCIKKNIFKIK